LNAKRRERVLIVNADDFGRTAGINHGIALTHEQGIVTSASLMVRWPAAPEAGRYARANPRLAVGLHLDLGEWTFSEGEWASVEHVVHLDRSRDVEAEVRRQLESFRALVGRDPTHLDSHQHVHTQTQAVGAALGRLGEELGVPVRSQTPLVRYFGDFYGQSATGTSHPELVGAERLIEIVTELPPGTTELGCHPGRAEGLVSSYREERELEIEALCDARVRDALDRGGIELCSFGELELDPA
jgi:predicted glycoside hydrolase/deacetylase ChbG (UPF0249 family)